VLLDDLLQALGAGPVGLDRSDRLPGPFGLVGVSHLERLPRQHAQDEKRNGSPLAKLEELRRLEEEEDTGREAQAVELLEALPVLPEGLSSAPEERLRRMFECFRLRVSYEKSTNVAHVRVSISEDTVEQVLADGAVLGDGGGEGTNCAALLCAPGGARHTSATNTRAPGEKVWVASGLWGRVS
jgi:hypothetical protein